jgi:uncharacterized protein with PQ loop repeat
VTAAVGVLAVVVTVVRAWPQAWHLVRHPEHLGVSVSTWVLALMTAGIWISYGVVEDEPVNLVANALAGLGSAGVLTALARRGRAVLPAVAGALAVVAALVALDRLAVDGALGVVGVAVGGGMFVPQAVRAVRAPTTAGISATAWWLVLAAAVIWSVYGALIDRAVVVAPGFIQFPAGAAVLLRLRADRVRAGATVAAGATAGPAAPTEDGSLRR